jgi:phosphotransferase system enzyme I (PtsI)
MIPMISNYEELIQTRKILEECKAELLEEKVKFRDDVPLGIMLEVPSAVLIADSLAKKVDFFSIGTNDLIQYTLAVDRGNEILSKLYQSFHPAVLSLIRTSVQAAHNRGIKVSVCGEMAADPFGAILLIGMGADELSVSFQYLGILKKVIRSIDYETARNIAKKALRLKSEQEVVSFMEKETKNRFPDLDSVLKFRKRNSNG